MFFLVTTFLAATIGLAVAWTTHVGRGMHPDAGASTHASALAGQDALKPISVEQVLVDMVPQNVVAAAAKGALLPLINAS